MKVCFISTNCLARRTALRRPNSIMPKRRQQRWSLQQICRARSTLLANLGYDIARDDAGGRLLPTYRLVAASAPAGTK